MRRTFLTLSLLIGSTLAAQVPGGPPPGIRPPMAGQPGGPPGPGDPFDHVFFPPELVMQHQGELGLQDAQRTAIQTAVQQAQTQFAGVQWKLSAEGEKMQRLLQGTSVVESHVLDEVDRVLALERQMKRAQVSLLVQIKNTLTPSQQAKLAEIRDRRE